MSVEDNCPISPLNCEECLRDASRVLARRMSGNICSILETFPNLIRREEFLVTILAPVEPTEDYTFTGFSDSRLSAMYFRNDAGEQTEDFQSLDEEVSLSCISSSLSVVLRSSSDSLETSSLFSVNSSIACDVPDEDYDADISSFIYDDNL